jgi:hypothetical protein
MSIQIFYLLGIEEGPRLWVEHDEGHTEGQGTDDRSRLSLLQRAG